MRSIDYLSENKLAGRLVDQRARLPLSIPSLFATTLFSPADLNAVNHWILPFILFLSLTLFCCYMFAGKGEMDRREKLRLWSFVKTNSLTLEK